jgi:Asp/Glu/hydantoin racemase
VEDRLDGQSGAERLIAFFVLRDPELGFAEGEFGTAETLATDPADAVLFGCTLWGGMVHEVADRVPAWSLDPVLTAFEVAIAQARIAASVRPSTR